MMSTYLPSLDPDSTKREKIRRRVRPVSRGQYADGRERFEGRKADVLRWLAWHFNATEQWPTSAELARFVTEAGKQPEGFEGPRDFVLHVRRGMSDLQDVGLVKSAGLRRCDVNGRKAETWRVKAR